MWRVREECGGDVDGEGGVWWGCVSPLCEHFLLGGLAWNWWK